MLSLAVFIWFLSKNPNDLAARIFFNFFTAFILVVVFVSLLGIALLAFTLFSNKPMGGLNNIMTKSLNSVYPLAFFSAKLLNINKDLIRKSYIETSNQLAKFRLGEMNLKKILLLAPHCLQDRDCPYKITVDIENCRRCGKCPIAGLYELTIKYKAKMVVATGGTLARDFIKQYLPEVILAIACERDLASGIHDVTSIPVIGVLNRRPNGPCCNTVVDCKEVENVLKYLCGDICQLN